MGVLNWFERVTSNFSAMLRRRGWFAVKDRREVGTEDAQQRAESLLPLIQSSFAGKFQGNLDVTALEEYLSEEASYRVVVELISLFGSMGFEFDAEQIKDWVEIGIPAASLYAVFELIKPRTREDLDAAKEVLRVNRERIRVNALGVVAQVYHQFKRPLALSNLVLALDMLAPQRGHLANNPVDTTGFVACMDAYKGLGIIDDRLDTVLLERMLDEEALAAAAALVDILMTHAESFRNFDQVREILDEIKDRITVRRLARVLALFDEYGVKAGALDAFPLGFAKSHDEIDWLERALRGMQELGRETDRLTLMQLKEWAPDIGAVTRFVSAARGFSGLGLTTEEIDQIVLQRAESEDASQMLGLVGELWYRLDMGNLTYDRAEHLVQTLTDRSILKRYETAANLLKEAKLDRTDIEALAEQFIRDIEDLYWLEGMLNSAAEFGAPLNRLSIMHLRERCPEPGHLYRFFRLKRTFHWYKGDHKPLDEFLIDRAPEQSMVVCLNALSELIQNSEPPTATIEEIKELDELLPDPELIEAYGVCVGTFNGDRRKFGLLLRQLAGVADIDKALLLVNKLLEGRLSTQVFERSFEILLTHLQRSPMAAALVAGKKEDHQ